MSDRRLRELGWYPELEPMLAEGRKRGLQAARVMAASRTFSTLLAGDGRQLKSRIPGRLHHLARRGGLLPVVGDWVLHRPGRPGREGVVDAVLPRKSAIVRQAPGRAVPQVICANVDTVLIVTGLDQDYNPRRIERYLALVGGSGAEAVVVLNKMELCRDLERCLNEVRNLGCPAVLPVSALRGEGLDALAPWLRKGMTLAMLGSSGAGKSTLANRLLGEERQVVGRLSERDGKGQHTTTQREMLVLPGGALLIDNPGMREIQLLQETTTLEEAFPDIVELGRACRFTDCRHHREPDCQVKEAVASGRLDEVRYQNFLKLQQELESREKIR
ncbi:ribosome biogenesis GTPase [Geothermobacter ehrlichii]|uniref:Small ribosomal subunit biogenesis GTPase RsgA n=1 Tax=Geothermobacter ehrlichii TaxID=213224 RepID=A0A5D3WP09_9BACT|nr:ribosome small subunit-dependent GTPase A [Geothermobacter ehrlichii]TYP00292.1 ribosome biogenesis GTPase [Geothermobacter ehrlichii]